MADSNRAPNFESGIDRIIIVLYLIEVHVKNYEYNKHIYNDAVIYARKHNMTVSTLVENFFISLLNNNASNTVGEASPSKEVKYRISPRVKALEMGYICPENLSIDYKEEIKEGKMRKSL